MNETYTDKLQKFLPEILFTFLFLFSYLPQFIYVWIPQLSNDSYAYLIQAKDFFEGNLPFQDYTMDLPYGFGFFIGIIFKLGGNLQWVILIQTIINLLAFLFLINSLKKISFNASVFFSILAWLYVSHSDSMLWNTLLYTESLYISSLVLLVSFMLLYLKTDKTYYIYLITIMILLASYARSNGIYLFFIPSFLFFKSLYLKNNLWKHILFSCFLICGISASTNYITKGQFFPFESKRIIMVLNDLNEMVKVSNSKIATKSNEIYDPNAETLKSQTIKLILNGANHQFGNHYYYRMPIRIREFDRGYIKKNITKYKTISLYKSNLKGEDNLINFIFMNITISQEQINKMLILTDIEQKPRHPWLYMNHLIHLSKPIGRNIVVVTLFYILFFYSMYILFSKNKFMGTGWETIFYVCCIHIISLISQIPFVPTNISLSRYSIVSEFVIFLSIALFIFNTSEGILLMDQIKKIAKNLKTKTNAQ